ncbi:MAG: pseudouridine-5'-phosphate glycosidase [Chloroflexi bacterium]|nr:pseudouridine-5'-phosphate glycosidase [Chloroflexota bacterium]
MRPLPASYIVDPAVARALEMGKPVVALESTVITHGLPHPENQKVAEEMEGEVHRLHAVPATIAVLDGRVRVGLNGQQLERLARESAEARERRKNVEKGTSSGTPTSLEAGREPRKLSARDLGPAIALRQSGGTTVAGTLAVAAQAGIEVFATGGIGGVHRGAPADVSADLPQLARSPLVVVCSGAKAILDLPATLEALETLGVPVVGYQTGEFPAFYSRSCGLPVTHRAETPEQVARIARAHWGLGLQSAVLVVNPPPADVALPYDKMEGIIQKALEEAKKEGKSGQEVTPYLLGKVSELSGGESLHTNLALLRNNARLAAQVAGQLARHGGELRA